MAEEFKILIRKRAVVKAKLTRLANAINQLENPTLSVLNTRSKNLEEIKEEFSAVQFEIELLDEATNYEIERDLFETLYYDSADKLAERIANLRPGRGGNNTVTNLTSPSPFTVAGSPSIMSGQNLLPKIKIKQFGGSFIEWHSFRDMFQTLVHENEALPIVHKFHLLKSYLVDNAATVIDALNATEENYFVAWDLLKKRFDKPRKIVQSHIRALFELAQVSKDSPSALRAFAEKVEMHINALKSLNQPVEWHEMLLYIVTAKLDKETRTAWERSIDEDALPTIQELIKFLNKYSRDTEPVPLISREQKSRQNVTSREALSAFRVRDRSNKAYVSTQSNNGCPICKQAHFIQNCEHFLKLNSRERANKARLEKLCMNCLRHGHGVAQCNSSSCRRCNGRHHSLLHFNKSSTVESSEKPVEKPSQRSSEEGTTSSTPIALTALGTSEILLSTARVRILDKDRKEHTCRVILDGCSQSNFITKRMADFLQLRKREINLPASGLGAQKNNVKHLVKTTIKSNTTNFSCEAEFLVLPQITENLPSRHFNIKDLPIPHNIRLADPELHKPASVDALLGEYFFYKLLSVGQIRFPNDRAVLQKTQLGWILSGEIGNYLKHHENVKCFLTTAALDIDLARFWEIEEYTPKRHFSKEEQACELQFGKTTTRDSTGRYQVRLPFNERKELLGDSYKMAYRRFHALEKTLESNSDLYSQYALFLKEYEDLGHMTDITDTADIKNGFYLPHHAVVKDNSLTTKVRVVFDGSAKTSSGISLNDTLLVGPTIQEDVFSLITRFRSHAFVLTADIEKMFRQIRIHDEDAIFQKILWRKNRDEPLRTFKLNTVTYGTASAPFLAVRCLMQLAEDERENFPVAAKVLESDFYMDDLLTGTATFEEAEKLKTQLIRLTTRGGFQLRQWASNEPLLITNNDERSSIEHFCLDPSETKKTLGIYWHSGKDVINYKLNLDKEEQTVTKRIILSKIAQLFDPLGLLGPVVIKAKIIMQELWKSGVRWDETVPQSIYTMWTEYREDLPYLTEFSVPREILIRNSISIQLHGFCDASEAAYGACIYLRSIDRSGQILVRLVCAKSRVAPIKTTSLPRLELCAALLLAKLYNITANSLNIQFDSIHFWSDSTITLHWINTSPHLLKTFVANRVAEIQSYTNANNWRHVASVENPADLISRGQRPTEIVSNKFWLSGPEWLTCEESAWPEWSLIKIDVPEQRSLISLPSFVIDEDILTRYSSFDKLIRFVAYCLRISRNASKHEKLTLQLSVSEIQRAHQKIIKLVQLQCFARELQQLQQGKNVNPKSKIASLTPFIDTEGIIRVGGRLHHASITYDQKHPILLPRSHHVTNLIIRKAHINNLHAGAQATLNAIRQRYWPIDGKNSTRFIIRKCIRCFKVKPTNPNDYIMGNLPKTRLTSTRPFENVGIDYCGPLFVKEKRFRNTKRLKVYVAVFVCFTTKAVHLELVSDLTTEAFLASLKRFFSRRGLSRHIYSDNATNFIGAKNELLELQMLIQSKEHNMRVSTHLANEGISWHFSPPRSPHFGGLWEAAVKSFKHHLVHTVGDSLFTYEQLNTYVIEIEAILNSRPLTPLSSDPNDFQALTPAHFLIGGSLNTVTEHNFTNVPSNRLSIWQHIQKVKQHFWTRWYKEYINELNVRSKWHSNSDDLIKLGTLVLLKDENLPPLHWSLGRVTMLHPGEDNITRVVTVKTNTGSYTRGVKNLYPLPIESDIAVNDKPSS